MVELSVGSASRTRWRWWVIKAIGRERQSWWKSEVGGWGIRVCGYRVERVDDVDSA